MSLHSQLILAALTLATFVARSQPASDSLHIPDTTFIRQNLNSVIINGDLNDAGVGQDLRDHYSENIDQLLDGSNGFSLTRRGNYAAEVIHRGMSSERMNVTIDGMKIFSACTDKMDPVTSYVTANNLKSMDTESAGEGKCFGSNIGGQVNLNSIEAELNKNKKVGGNTSIAANSASKGYQGTFSTYVSEEKYAIRINGMASDHQNYRSGGGEIIEHSQYRKTNFGFSVKTKISKQSFLLANYINDEAKNVGYPALPMDVSIAKASIYSATYRKYFTSHWARKLDVKIYGNNIKHVMDDSQREVVMHMDMPGQSDTYGAYAAFDLQAYSRHKVQVIFDAYRNRSLAEMTMYPKNEVEMYMMTWPDVQRSDIGVFVSDQYSINDRYSLLMTFRHDWARSSVEDEFGKRQLEVFGYDLDDDIFQKTLNYSAKLSRKVGKNNQLSFELAYAERLPSISEQFAFYIFNSQDNYDYIGDPFIKNEEAYQSELSYELNKKSWSLINTVFAYHIPNYIFGRVNESYSAMTIGASGVKEYINLPYANIYGFESAFYLKFLKRSTIGLNLTYNYGIDNDNKFLPLMTPFKLSSSYSYSVRSSKVNLYFTGASAQNNFSELAGENKTPAYAIVGFSYQYTVFFDKSKVELLAGIDNMFDARYWDHQDWVDLPRQGRNAFVKVQYHF